MPGGVAPSVSRIIVLLSGGDTGGSLDTGEQPGAWTQPGHMIDGGYLQAAEQCCPVFLRKISGMIPTLHGEHGERLSEKALESVLRLLIMSTEKSWKTIINRVIS